MRLLHVGNNYNLLRALKLILNNINSTVISEIQWTSMFIIIAYKDAPELSTTLRRSSSEMDLSLEKTLLVNPNCPVRVMLEYIRKKCRLGSFTAFDLCDESGCLMGLFNMETYAYATDQFMHKKTYYVIVLKTESDKTVSVLPQLNHESRLYNELKEKVKQYLINGTPEKISPPPGKSTPPGKVTPPIVTKGKKK